MQTQRERIGSILIKILSESKLGIEIKCNFSSYDNVCIEWSSLWRRDMRIKVEPSLVILDGCLSQEVAPLLTSLSLGTVSMRHWARGEMTTTFPCSVRIMRIRHFEDVWNDGKIDPC